MIHAIKQLITFSPEIQSGTPVFYKTRVPVKNLFDYLKAGDSLEDFLKGFPSVKRKQTIAILEFVEKIIIQKDLTLSEENPT